MGITENASDRTRKADYQYISNGRKNQGLIIKSFGNDLAEWIDFVCSCREGNEEYKQFDLIIGRVANDRVYRVVNMYRLGYWDRNKAHKEMKVYPEYDQIAFITQRAINQMLMFENSREV